MPDRSRDEFVQTLAIALFLLVLAPFSCSREGVTPASHPAPNGTAIGASANVIVVGIAEKMGSPISFKKFMLYGMPLMIESVIICTGYVWLRYYVLKI